MAEIEQGKHGGARAGAGRKRVENAPDMATVSAYLSAEDRAYLALISSNNTQAVRELIEKARLFWPKGF